jgi:hypothetical protein
MQTDSPELTLKLIDALVQGGFIKGATVLVAGQFITVDLTVVATARQEQVLSDIRSVCPELPPVCLPALAAALRCVPGAEYWSLKFDFATDEAASLITLDADRLMKRSPGGEFG